MHIGLRLLGTLLIAYASIILVSIRGVIASLFGPGIGELIGVGSHVGAIAMLVLAIGLTAALAIFGLMKVWLRSARNNQ
jgi:hypothetical protein